MSAFCFFRRGARCCDIICYVKPLVLTITKSESDRKVITQAAFSHGCRVSAAGSAAGALSLLKTDSPALIFCDAELAEGGGALRVLSEAFCGSGTCIILLFPPAISQGLLRALRPWVQDFLATPVLREAATAKIRNALRMTALEHAVGRAVSDLQGWLSRLESAIQDFDPFTGNRMKAHDDLVRRLIRTRPDDAGRPTHLMIGMSDGSGGLQCDLYASTPAGPEKLCTGMKIPESAVFLGIKEGDRPSYLNYFDRRKGLRDFQSLFPSELLTLTGTVCNVAGFAHAGTYVVALNYGRPVTAGDVLFLRGLALPGSFLGAVAGDMREISESFLLMARALAMATDSQNDNGAHVRRMNEYARAMAERMKCSPRFVRTISYSAQLHDVGKIYIHPDLLDKPLRLTSHEFDLVKKHPLLGARILGDSPALNVARNIALTHHECWDGSGYPAGLSGEAIPVEGAIVKIADVYDALRTMHSYKASLSHDDACRFILDGGGDGLHEIRPAQFHPGALRAFGEASREFEDIYQGTQ